MSTFNEKDTKYMLSRALEKIQDQVLGISLCFAACFLLVGSVAGAQSGLLNQAAQGQQSQTRPQQGSESNRGPAIQVQPVGPHQSPIAGENTSEVATDQPVLAEEIISILKREPGIRESVKKQLTAASGQKSSTLTDDDLYNRVRDDIGIRALALKEIEQQGYFVDSQSRKQRSGTIGAESGNVVPDEIYENPNDPQTQTVANPYRTQIGGSPNRTQIGGGPNQTQTGGGPNQTQTGGGPNQTQTVQTYESLTSLVDLYSQFPTPSKELSRYGSRFFTSGTNGTDDFSTDLPVGPDYILGSGDNITINMWGGESQQLTRIIDRQGRVELPEAGVVTISGMTVTQAQQLIQKALDSQFRGEKVEIAVGKVRSVRIYVVGDVQRPGAYDVSSLSTPLNALIAAGGPTSRGSLRKLLQYRGGQLLQEFDLYDFWIKGVQTVKERLLPGDTILVPPVGPLVSVEGMVRRPAIYELNGEQSLDQVLEIAGGVLVSASMKQIKVERIEAHQTRTMIDLQLPSALSDAKQKLSSFSMRDGDYVVINQILPYNSQAVYLEGHVYRPGRYPYRDGMTISDLLGSYQDLMPEPSEHVELVRLNPPDFHPETINLNLPDLMIGNNALPLRPFDLVRVFGRYEVDSPIVTINGAVLRPGEYPMSHDMTVSKLIAISGGYKRSAFRESADLSSYTINNGKRVLTTHSEINLQIASGAGNGADTALKPGDVLSIRSMEGWDEIGATVTINGEVVHPGTYGVEQGERLSSLIKRAGGFRKDAYPFAAAFERQQVAELNDLARQRMIRRIQEASMTKAPTLSLTNQSSDNTIQLMESQRQQILASLRSAPITGRLIINISSSISSWENTPLDIELRPGDKLLIPKRPEFVIASGQVNNPVGISYLPGKKFDWYLKKAGGASPSGNGSHPYLIRADGTVLPCSKSFLSADCNSVRMRPGDTIFVPEKIVGGSQVWQNILITAQVLSAAALPFALVHAF